MGNVLRNILNAKLASAKKDQKIKNVLLYLRVSTDRQASKEFSSIDAQRKILADFVAQNPIMRIVGEYVDSKSAKDTNRQGFQDMMARIKKGGIDIVLSYKNDRVNRNHADFLQFKEFLDQHNVKLIYSHDTASDGSPTGDLIEDISASISEMERKKISARTADKTLANYERGYRSGGVPPFGYVSGDKPCEIVVDKKNAPIVREIFNLYLNGIKPSGIANKMNDKYTIVPIRYTKTNKKLGGRPFNEKFIRDILANPTYAGYNYILLDIVDGVKEFYLFEGKHQAIISRKKWETVRETIYSTPHERKENKLHSRKHQYLLKGKLYCDCGSRMTGSHTSKASKIHFYYICCRKNKEHSACSCTTMIPRDLLDNIVFVIISHAFRGEIKIKKESLCEIEENILKKIKSTQMAILRTQEKVERLTDELVSVEKDDPMREVINISLRKELERKSTLQCDLDILRKEQDGLTNSCKYSDSILTAFANLEELQSNITESEKKTIISTVIKKITLSCIKKNGRFKREMSLQIHAMPEYISIIPKTKFVFEIDTSSGRSLWKITSPFNLDGIDLINHRLQKKPLCKGKHFLHDVITLKKDFELSKLTLRDFAKNKNLNASMLCLKFGLLKKLSQETLNFILALVDIQVIQRISFRKLLQISTISKDRQLLNLKTFLSQI